MSVIAKNHTLIINKSAVNRIKLNVDKLKKIFHGFECSEDDFLFKVSYYGASHPHIHQLLLKHELENGEHYSFFPDAGKVTFNLPSWLDIDTIKDLSKVTPLDIFSKQENVPSLKLSEINKTLVNVVLPNDLFSEKRMSNFIIIEDFTEKREANLRTKNKKPILSEKNNSKLDIPTIIKNIFNKSKK